AAVNRDSIKMRPSVPLRWKMDGLVVASPTERDPAGTAHPGVVVLMFQNFGLAAGRINQERPAILVVRRAGERYGVLTVFRPLRVQNLHVTFAFLRALRRTLRFRSLPVRILRGRLRLALIRLRLLLAVINPVHFAGLD